MNQNGIPTDRINKLSPAKRALLEKRLGGKFAETSNPGQLCPRPAQDLYPLSFAQERLWFLGHLAQGKALFNRPMVFRLTGTLNVRALQRALKEILRRHEVLRASFPTSEGLPTQIITPLKSHYLPVKDLCGQSPEKRKVELGRVELTPSRLAP